MDRWSINDDLAALYVFRFGTTGLPYSLATVAKRRGVDPGSFKMRVSNFKAAAGGRGLENFARQTSEVYERRRNTSMAELRRMAFPELDAR
jgi:hypothetical protein